MNEYREAIEAERGSSQCSFVDHHGQYPNLGPISMRLGAAVWYSPFDSIASENHGIWGRDTSSSYPLQKDSWNQDEQPSFVDGAMEELRTTTPATSIPLSQSSMPVSYFQRPPSRQYHWPKAKDSRRSMNMKVRVLGLSRPALEQSSRALARKFQLWIMDQSRFFLPRALLKFSWRDWEVQAVCVPVIDARNPASSSGAECRICDLDTDCASPQSEMELMEDESDESDESLTSSILSHLPQRNTFDTALRETNIEPAKSNLVDRLMEDCWISLSHLEHRVATTCEAGTSTSSATGAGSGLVHGNSSKFRGTKRTSDARKEQDSVSDDEPQAQRPKTNSTLPVSVPRADFACPYRKYNPRKYTVSHWRSCALTPHNTIARVKGHLYRHHLIFQCPRCKEVFPAQTDLDDHFTAIQACDLSTKDPVEGITANIEKRLRSKKKAHRLQTDEDRWREIYQILFPDEEVPGPYFEPIQEEVVPLPEYQELASYEDYSRQELPRLFRRVLERTINREAKPIDDQFRIQLTSIIQECQDQIFANYRAQFGGRGNIPVPKTNAPQLRTARQERRTQTEQEQLYQHPAARANTLCNSISTLEENTSHQELGFGMLSQSEVNRNNDALGTSSVDALVNGNQDPAAEISTSKKNCAPRLELHPFAPELGLNGLNPKSSSLPTWDETKNPWSIEYEISGMGAFTWNPSWENWVDVEETSAS